MSNYQLYGGDGLPGTATNPIGEYYIIRWSSAFASPASADGSWSCATDDRVFYQDLTVAQDGAGSGPAHFADPWHSYAHSISNAANPPAGWAITNGPQDHIAYENSLFPAFDLRALEESDYDNELAEYRKRLQSARCVRCKAPIKVDAATLIQNTVKMMKQSGRSTFARVMADTDNPRLSPPVLSLLQVQGMVLRRRRHVQQGQRALTGPRRIGEELQSRLVLR